MRRFLDWTAAQTAGNGQTNVPSSNLQPHSNTYPQPYSTQTNTMKDLEIQHLMKLLHDIKYYQASSSPLPSAINSQNQRDFVDKIYKTLPLFLNAFGSSTIQTLAAGSSTMFTLIDSAYTGTSGGLGGSQADRSISQSSLLSEEAKDWSQSESCPNSKPSSPLPPRSPPMDKFPDLLPFAFTIGRLFVSEVRQRASDKHAEDASFAILQFLNAKQAVNDCHQRVSLSDKNIYLSQDKASQQQQQSTSQCNYSPDGKGWTLLLSLNTLASSQNSQIIQLLCDASLPSTLIKCLYLFYDLPVSMKCKKSVDSSSSEKKEESSDNPDIDDVFRTRDLIGGSLIKAFTQLLVQLCSYQSAIDELIRKDDLRLVLGIASSQCSPQNRVWRKTASYTLQAISRNMRDNFIYLEQNPCIQVYVDNLNRSNSLGLAGTEDIVEMIRILIDFVYNLDVNNRNQPKCIVPVIEQIKTSRILETIEELLFKIDDCILQELNQAPASDQDPLTCPLSQQPSVSSEVGVCVDDYRRFGRRLIQTFIKMSKIYYHEDAMAKNMSLKPLAMNRFEMLEQFKMPRPTARDCVLNNEALRIFKLAWSKCKDHQLIEAVLDATISLFNDDKYNYFVYESEQLLVYYMSSPNFNSFPCKLRQKLFKFLEFIVIETSYIPCLELGTLGAILASKNATDYDRILILKTLIACLRFSSKFSDIFRDIGILEVIINMFNDAMQDDNLTQAPEKLEILYLLLESSQYLLVGSNNLNCTQFNESGAARHVFNCLSKPKYFQLFVSAHSSSSDDGGPASRNSTPTPTGIGKASGIRNHLPLIQAKHNLMDLNSNRNLVRPTIKQMQKVAFAIIRQLILSNAGDEHLANLLGLLARTIDDLRLLEAQDDKMKNTDNSKMGRTDLTFLISQEVNLKIYILKSLMIILKDNHRCRTLFRKIGGFVYLVSALVALEKSLPLCEEADEESSDCRNRWMVVNSRRIWRLVKNVFMTIIVAMRSEPANLRVFTDDTMPRFTEAIRGLGCFQCESAKFQQMIRAPPKSKDFELYKSILLSPPARDLSTTGDRDVLSTEACCQILRFLYDMSLDMADGTSELEEHLSQESGQFIQCAPAHSHHGHQNYDSKSLSFDQSSTEPAIYKRRSQLQQVSARPPSLDLNACTTEPAILTFPSVILCMLDLIPYCPNEELMMFACMIIRSLFKHERNQQLLCEAGMIGKLLNSDWQVTLTTRAHFLHNMAEFMFERLTKQAITPLELRAFLRLGDPLCCKNLDDIDVPGDFESPTNLEEVSKMNGTKQKEKIATCRIETFVNMMSREQNGCQPPFVEFNPDGSGSSYIFMPSIAPVNAKSMPQNLSHFLNSTLDVHITEKNGILGGVGSTERLFPPNNGLTFSSWVCIEQFPSRSSDPNHNIRLLTIYRASAATGKEYSCLRVQISALDRALTVSTQETLLFDHENRPDNQNDPDCFVRVWTPETLAAGQWHHIVVTLSRSSQKQSGVYIYIDGQLIHNQRISYISAHVGPSNSGLLGTSGSSNLCSSAAFVNAFIGSLPQIKLQTRTLWRQGPCHLLEDQISSNFVSAIHTLGPNHIGNFQSMLRAGESKHKSVRHGQSVGEHHSARGPLVHQSASTASHSSPRHGYPLTRVSSSGMNSHASAQQAHSISSGSQFQVSEDRVLISLDARSSSYMSLTRMRKIYTRFDCRQATRFLGLSTQESSTPLLLLHNTAVHLNGPSRGVGALTIGYNHVRCFIPSPTEQTLFQIGGSYVLIGFVAQAQTANALFVAMRALVYALINNPKLQAQIDNINGFQILTVMLWKKKHLLNRNILNLVFAMVKCDRKLCSGTTDTNPHSKSSRAIVQISALRELICECFDLWLHTNMINPVLEFIYDLISSAPVDDSNSTSIRTKNLKYLRDMDLLPRMLRLLPRDPVAPVAPKDSDNSIVFESSDSSLAKVNEASTQTFDAKAIYLIKQTVFELLNRTPRQSDILYFGQFLTSLLPSTPIDRSEQTVNLRNVLLKSLLQMMTRNKQSEVNHAMQEELARILGFDWFMLFISSSNLNNETITLGFLNLMILLSNEELYTNFKNKTTSNGGWLKEPTFPTMDGKFNIQLLGINVGVFFGLSSKGKAICQDILEAPNFCLLNSCLLELKNIPHIYLMLFQTMIGRLSQLDAAVFDQIATFEKLNLDSLCDSLIGETHHKRRQTLTGIQFRNLEIIVSLTYMIGDVMRQISLEQIDGDQKSIDKNLGTNAESPHLITQNFPADIVRFFMYLYNNNQEFQNYCRRSDDLIDALSESLTVPVGSDRAGDGTSSRTLTQHPASKEVLELSRLIILDRMTESSSADENEFGTYDQLRTFERFLEALSSCKEAQIELIDMLLRQILLIIDSTSRLTSTKTINSAENFQQFRLLLINSVLVSQMVVDKIWSQETFSQNYPQISVIINHQLALAEQIFKFNEVLPKNNPPYAFIMQHNLNRIILYAISRPISHMSDRMFMLDLLKKIYDNRTIIILNHMHSPHSAEFFVCMTYCLMSIIEDNCTTPSRKLPSQQSIASDHPPSLIELQHGHPKELGHAPQRGSSITDSPSSSNLMLVSMARKVWDAIYQSKRGILSEAFEVPLTLPAFTLETSLDLIQLKPDINEHCKKFWSAMLESEQRPRKRLQAKQNDTTQGATSAAVNILSGRLTRVVNAASFVSRVVGATAGSMASNVNLVGERLTQTSRQQAFVRPQRSPSDLSSTSIGHRSSSSVGEQTNLSPASMGYNSQSHTNQQAQSQQPLQTISMTANDINFFKHHKLTQAQISSAMRTHISIIDDYIKVQMSQKNHKLELHKYLCDEWLDAEAEVLLRERAIFGPERGSNLDRWCLDLTEGPRRMRKKMAKNTKQFYDNYSYCPEQFNPSNKSLRYRPPMSFDSRQYYFKTLKLEQILFVDANTPQDSKQSVACDESTSLAKKQDVQADNSIDGRVTPKIDKQDTPLVAISSTDSPAKKKLYDFHSSSLESLSSALRFQSNSPKLGDQDGDQDDGDSTSFVDFSPEIEAETNSARESENIDSLSVLRLLEKNERISHMFRCSRVQGLDTHEGLLLFGREHFYLIDGFTLLKTREIKDIDSLPPDAHEPIIPNSTPNIMAHSKKTCAKFSYESVMEVHKRRYLLQPIALEIFSSDGRNALIVFPRNIRNKVHSRLLAVATQITNNAQESLAGQKSNVSVEGGSGLLSNLMGETSVTQRWVRGELSNFQYLMNLNTIAGRSYNDLMQYPIFPWVLADYTSDYLDLNKLSTFRDLSRPIGAQTSERLDQFKRRYSEWDDTETPPYHYGTFYSSAMIVASYMVRMEPFTQHFLRLQGGHFDLADRMFHSINDSWLSASKHNMADIRELVPEFFYLPEFLKNDNKYDLGIKQNGMHLDDVILPPWAKDDAREFIRLHRCALESDYVSAHLHEWIDLIFGHKQQGQAAVEAVNVFHHLFYEGNVDIYNTDIDPIKKNAVIGFINNFGQIPKQLFKKPHPMRKVTNSGNLSSSGPIPLTPILPTLSGMNVNNAANQRSLTHSPQMLRLTNTTFKDLRGPVGQIAQVDKNIVAVEQNKLLIPPEYCRYIAWGHADRSLRLGLYESEKPIFVWEGSDNLLPYEILCSTIPNNRTMITAGTDSVITVWKIEKMRSFTPTHNLYGHVEPVTCLASSQAYSIIVSGSRDRTAIIWDLNKFTFVRQLGALTSTNTKPIHRGPISAIAINDSTGDIATCATSWLYLWSINGELLAQVDTFSVAIQQSMLDPDSCSSVSSNLNQLHILSVCFSQHKEWDLDEVILTGSSDGSVAFWSMRYYQSLMSAQEIEEAAKKEADRYIEVNNVPASGCGDTDNIVPQSAAENMSETSTDPEKKSNGCDAGVSNEPEMNERGPVSDPIAIRTARRRTDTMNSEWVRLSTSSASTADTIPVLQATPNSPNELYNSSTFLTSGESFIDESTAIRRESCLPTAAILSQGGDEQQDPNDNTEIAISGKLSSACILTEAVRSARSDSNMSLDTDSPNRGQDEELNEVSMTSKANLLLTPNDPSLIKFSKSDTSLVDSFVLLGDSSPRKHQIGASSRLVPSPTCIEAPPPSPTPGSERARPQSSADSYGSTKPRTSTPNRNIGRRLVGHRSDAKNKLSLKLQMNHCWRRELYLRGVLPKKRTKLIPPAITCLTVSKDHRNLYVGDAFGRITCWSTN